MKKKGVSLLILLSISLFLSGCATEESLQDNLYSMAKAEIKIKLKAPSTAKFGKPISVMKIVEYTEDDPEACWDFVYLDSGEDLSSKYDDYDKIYELSFAVEAQNSYGVPIMETYTCRIDSDDEVFCDKLSNWESDCVKGNISDYY